jgi:IS5 family transposase
VERNRLKGTQGNPINALLSAAAMNFKKLLGFLLCRLLQFLRSLFVPASRDQFLAVMP